MTPESGPYDSVTTQDSTGDRVIVQPEWDNDPFADRIDYRYAPEVGQSAQDAVTGSIADAQRRHQATNRIFTPPQQWIPRRIVANPPAPGLLLKDTPGTFHSVLIVSAGTGWVVNFCDDTLEGTNIIARYVTAMGVGLLWLDYQFKQALTITATGTAGEITVAFI